MKISNKGISLIKEFESLELFAYKCPAGVWTLGFGTTIKPNGRPVTAFQKCTIEQANEYLSHSLRLFEKDVNYLTKGLINQNQFDALVSFCYNLGSNSLHKSTLLKKLLINPNDESIYGEFIKWNKAIVNGKMQELEGLTRRRKKEANLYFTK